MDGLLQGAGSLLGSIVNTVGGAVSAKKQRAHDKEMSEYTYKKDLEQWNRQNKYNSPESQMQRYADAGINPHMVASKGSSGNATSSPAYQKPSTKRDFRNLQIPDVIGKHLDYKMKKIQTDNAKKVGQGIDASTQGQLIKNKILDHDLGDKPNYYSHQQSERDQKVKIWKHDIEKMEQQNRVSKSQADWLEKKFDTYSDSGINIDKDDKTIRMIMEIFGEDFKSAMKWLKNPSYEGLIK